MSDILSFCESEQQNICDTFLPTAALASWGVWGAEEPAITDHTECTELDRCDESPFNQRCTAFEKQGKLAHPRHVLVVGKDKECVRSEEHPYIISPESVLSSSTLSSFSEYATEDHQLSSPYVYDNEQQYQSNYNSPARYSPDFASQSPSFYQLFPDFTSSTASSIDLDLDYSHLVCSHNIDDFGDDIAYGKSGGSLSSPPEEVSAFIQTTPDFSFIDSIYESVRAEIEAEKIVSNPPSGTAGVSTASPVITLGLNSPVTIVAGDGKEYKVVLQEVNQEGKTGLKRKASTVSTPKPKRSPGVPLANMSIEEINARKREQNRVAAQRYREKKKNCKETEKEEEERLEKRNSYLRVEAARLQEEINDLRKAILERVAAL